MKKKKVAFLSRVSTLDQHSSIENQDLIFKQWLENNLDCEYYKTYTDEGISGSKAYKRPEFLKMIQDGIDRRYDVLVTKSYSRFARNQRESLSAIAELRIAGIRLVFLEEGMDTDKDIKNAGLHGWLAEMEAQKTSERIKTVWDSFNREGRVHVTLAPYGYDYNKEIKNFVVNEKEASGVRKIFELYLQGNGFNKIAKVLSDSGVPSKRGGNWAGATIKGILENEFYIGTLVQGKSRTIDVTIKGSRAIAKEEWFKHIDNHEGIITQEVFDKTNQQINDRTSKAKSYYTKEHANSRASRHSNASLFSNLMKCGDCGATMTIKRKKRLKYVPFYNCISYDMYGTKECNHTSNSIKEEFLMEYVKRRLDRVSENNFDELSLIVNSVKESKNNTISLEKELQIVEKKIDEQIELSTFLLTNYSKGIISDVMYKLQNESMEKALDSLLKRKKEILGQMEQAKNSKSDEVKLKRSINDLLGVQIDDWSNSALKEAIERIEVYTNGIVKVHFKYFNQL